MAGEDPVGAGAGRPGPNAPNSFRGTLLRVLAAAGVALVALGAKSLLLDGEGSPSDTRGANLREIEVGSDLLERDVPVNVVVPKGAFDGKRSLVVFLHGRNGDESSHLDQEMYGALARLRGKAPVVAFPGGDETSYWHDREAGAWGSFVLDELIPKLVERFEIEPERVAIGGISMGGFGAYNLARRQPERFCAIGAHAPAVWLSAGETAPGAFDDAEDFERNNVIAALGPGGESDGALDEKATWVDVGTEDPFAGAAGALGEALESGEGTHSFRTGAGGHEDSYWTSKWRSYIRFYGTELKACGDALRERRRAERASGEPGA